MKIVSIILGVIMILGGVYCVFTPVATYSAISWLIGIAMLVEGIGSVVTWNQLRKQGFADGWTLAGAIVSIILGCFLLGSFAAQFAVDLFIAYLIAIWLVVGGVVRIAAAVKLRKYQNEIRSMGVAGINWGLLLVMGILVTIFGVLCLFNPLSVMIGIGMMLGLSIICVGVDLIVHGTQM